MTAFRLPPYLRLVAFLWQALLAVLAAGPALAQTSAPQPKPAHIAAQLLAEAPVAPGKTTMLAIHMRPAPGWHGYWQNPGDAGFGMRLEWRLPAGVKVGTPLYPVPETLVISGLMNHVFNADYAVLIPLAIPATAAPGTRLTIAVRADWLACTREICVPESGDLTADVAISPLQTPAATSPVFDNWRAKLPAPLSAKAHFALSDTTIRLAIPFPASSPLGSPHIFPVADHVIDYAAPQHFARKGDLLLVTLGRAKGAPALPSTFPAVLALGADGGGLSLEASPGPVPTGGQPLALPAAAPDLARLPWLIVAALAGGLLLNVMPCVFPILSLKALSLARAGQSEAEARTEGLAYTAGVVLACLLLGGGLLALRAGGQQLGWAFQLQEPAVVAALLMLAVAITVNLLGAYEFAVPFFARGGGAKSGPKHGTASGAFATGLLAAFVATPCTGPFMAGAMGAALLMPVAPAMLLFAALGLGIALPFLAIAFIPALRRAMPRPGAWMVWFRRAMALPMGLTALALVWLASRLGGWNFAVAALGVAALLVALLAMLGAGQRRGRAMTLPIGGLLAALALGAAVFLPQSLRAPVASAPEILNAQPFSEAAVATARAQGHPVFVYFTADWCLTCKVNERIAIEREATRAAFARAGVVVLKGDWTRRDPAITRFLTSQGAAGVPLYLWYAKGSAPARQLPQVLTLDMLAKLPG